MIYDLARLAVILHWLEWVNQRALNLLMPGVAKAPRADRADHPGLAKEAGPFAASSRGSRARLPGAPLSRRPVQPPTHHPRRIQLPTRLSSAVSETKSDTQGGDREP